MKNYHGAFVDQLWNGEEFIMAKGAETGVQNIQRYGGPRSIAGDMSKGWKTTCVPTMEAVEMYYTKNGLPLEDDPLTKDADLYRVAPGDSTALLHRNREPASTPASASTAGRSRSTVRPSRSNCAAANCTAAR